MLIARWKTLCKEKSDDFLQSVSSLQRMWGKKVVFATAVVKADYGNLSYFSF